MVEKLLELGAKPVTLSDSNGYIYDPDGIDERKLESVKELKNVRRGRIKEYAKEFGCQYYEAGGLPWEVKCDIAFPCATQEEIDEKGARTLVKNGCMCVVEGANMPALPEAIRMFQQARVLFGPSKVANAGGVATSGLENVPK